MEEDIRSLQHRLQQLEKEIVELRRRNAELERAKNGAGPDIGELPVEISEFEETLRRLVQRTAMIVQAEKCVIMVRDRETGELFARSPAFGMAPQEVASYRISGARGISGEVFRTGNPTVCQDTTQDSLALEEGLSRLHIRNGITVPLIVEKRDDEHHIVDRVTIGVLHCFNKRYGGEFIEEDVRLLERLSRNAAAVIANAQMFQEVIEEKQKLVHTLESLTAGLILINQHQRIGQMNAQARAMFGLAPHADPLGKDISTVIKHEQCLEIIQRKLIEADAAQPESSDSSAKEEENKRTDEISVLDQDDQEYIYQVHGAVVRDDIEKPIGTVIIFNDITDIRNVERMKTEFVSIVSHELRTPLTPMKGFVRTLLDDENEEWYTREDRREFYGIIDENVDRLGRLINDLLNVSRIERLGPKGLEMNWEMVDLRKATEAVVSMQRGRTDKHTLVVDFEPETITAETDADKIQNILHNLVSNAIKYSPEGGEVRIIGRLEPAIEERPESALIGVRDQGLGIPEAVMKKLGEKFFRIDHRQHKHKVGGTGIGLFLVKNLVAAHHGQMWPESEGIGKGATFWVRIPVQQPEEEIPPEAEAGDTPDAS